jgi:hypothetical protein
VCLVAKMEIQPCWDQPGGGRQWLGEFACDGADSKSVLCTSTVDSGVMGARQYAGCLG